MAFFNLEDKYNKDFPEQPGEHSGREVQVADNIITEYGRKILGQKIRLLVDKKPSLAEDVAVARDNGGMEENEELDMALNAVERVEHEIKKYEAILATYRLVEIPEVGEYEKVRVGCKVELLNLNTEKTMTYQILGEIESDPANGIISHKSPLGSELIGLYQGDIAEIERSANDYIEYEILRIFVD